MANTRKYIDQWDNFMSGLLANAPAGMKNGFAIDIGTWVFSSTQLDLLVSAKESLGVVFGIVSISSLDLGHEDGALTGRLYTPCRALS